MNQVDVHHQHTQWQSEHMLWQEELRIWKDEHRQALMASMKIEEALKKLDDEIEDLERHIMDHDVQIEEHELNMAIEHKGASTTKNAAAGNAMADLHTKEITVHEHQVNAFEKAKKKHQLFMKSVNRLNEVIHSMI